MSQPGFKKYKGGPSSLKYGRIRGMTSVKRKMAPPKQWVAREGSSSAFIITINANIMPKSDFERNQLIQQYTDFAQRLKKKFEWDMCKLPMNAYGDITEFRVNLESGGEKKRLHIHINVSFNLLTRLDLEAIRQLTQEVFGRRLYVNCRYIRDHRKSMADYVNKDGVELEI